MTMRKEISICSDEWRLFSHVLILEKAAFFRLFDGF